MAQSGPPSTFGGVVQLINKLQRACGDIGENAASDGGASDIPALWNLLPSIVVIGGQVTTSSVKAAPPTVVSLQIEQPQSRLALCIRVD